MTVVIDTSALMAFVKGEPGGASVGPLLGQAIASPVILAETLSKLARQGFDPVAIQRDLLTAGLKVEALDPSDVASVVSLYQLSEGRVSLADRFCLALAMDRGLPVLTGDRPWAALGLTVEVRLIR